MGKPCTVCAHPDRNTIDIALEAGHPLRRIARTHGVSKTALHRHHNRHLVAVAGALEESPAQGTVIQARSESRSWNFPKWVWRQVWGRKGVLAIVAGAIGYMVRGLTPRR
jgi:hypothetical protein